MESIKIPHEKTPAIIGLLKQLTLSSDFSHDELKINAFRKCPYVSLVIPSGVPQNSFFFF